MATPAAGVFPLSFLFFSYFYLPPFYFKSFSVEGVQCALVVRRHELTCHCVVKFGKRAAVLSRVGKVVQSRRKIPALFGV
jgi:hypothetical protein